MFAGFVAGVVAASATNALEVVTVTKQTNPEMDIFAMIRKERSQLLFKGLSARVYYNGVQSLFFFTLVEAIGR